MHHYENPAQFDYYILKNRNYLYTECLCPVPGTVGSLEDSNAHGVELTGFDICAVSRRVHPCLYNGVCVVIPLCEVLAEHDRAVDGPPFGIIGTGVREAFGSLLRTHLRCLHQTFIPVKRAQPGICTPAVDELQGAPGL